MSRGKIKSLRKLRKLSQAALGGLCGLTGAEISRIECGYRDLSSTEAAAIAAALSVPLDTLSMVTANGSPPASPVLSPNGMNKAMGLAAAITAKPINTLESKPVGSDLSDPVNFAVLPDPGVLEQGGQSATAFRSRLSAEVNYANRILHASRIPAAVWRTWRDFERRLTERLRAPFVRSSRP